MIDTLASETWTAAIQTISSIIPTAILFALLRKYRIADLTRGARKG